MKPEDFAVKPKKGEMYYCKDKETAKIIRAWAKKHGFVAIYRKEDAYGIYWNLTHPEEPYHAYEVYIY